MFLCFSKRFVGLTKPAITDSFSYQNKNFLFSRKFSYLASTRLHQTIKHEKQLLQSRNFSTTKPTRKQKFGSLFGERLHQLGMFLSSKEYRRFETKVFGFLFCCFLIYGAVFYERNKKTRAFTQNISLRKEYQAWKEYEKIVNNKDVTFEDLVELKDMKLKERTLKILKYNDEMKQKREEAERRKQEAIKTGYYTIGQQETFVEYLKERLPVAEAKISMFMSKTNSSGFSLDNLINNLQEEDLDKPISEYESLKYDSMTKSDKMRTRDVLKLAQYNYMIQEYGLNTFDNVTIPHYQSIKVTLQQLGLPENDENDKLLQEVYDLESIHEVMPEMDTINFFDEKAMEYDSSIKKEEYIFINRQRKKLAKKLSGDCLETSCGTGRNIKYLDLVGINSITFLDPSQKMLEVCKEKFEDINDKFSKVAFVKGRCEDLVEEGENAMKYDCIFETFGLCSQKDPVQSLNNMAKLLKEDGRIYLLEHGKSTYESINRKMNKSMEKRLEHWGCRYNLDLGEIIDDSDLEIVSEERKHLGTTWIYTLKLKDSKVKDAEQTGSSGWLSKLR